MDRTHDITTPAKTARSAATQPAEMFEGKTAAAWRAEYADADDWGPHVGREIVLEQVSLE